MHSVFSKVIKLFCIPKWRQKLTQLRNLGIEASIFNYLEEVATDNERTAGLDIADYLLQIEPAQAVLQAMIRRNPILQKLIDDLQLTLVSVERYNPDTDAINKTSKTKNNDCEEISVNTRIQVNRVDRCNQLKCFTL